MAEEDIYGSKKTFDRFKGGYKKLLDRSNKNTYYCKNKNNKKYFEHIFKLEHSAGNSYIRLNCYINLLKKICTFTNKELSTIDKTKDRDEINKIQIEVNKTINESGRQRFPRDIKKLWKDIFPVKEKNGEVNEDMIPYVVRHLKYRMDKSKEKVRKDKLSPNEVKNILNYFSNKLNFKSYLELLYYGFARPQELSYTKIKDLELEDDYGKLQISEHGKEGTKFIEIIDSFPTVLNWYNQHPFKDKKNEFFFFNNYNKQLTPFAVNKQLKLACKKLGIAKPITCYSFKRNGITHALLSGESHTVVEKRAGWTSTKQIATYDLSEHEDSFKIQLAKRGMLKGKEKDKYKDYINNLKTKRCVFCDKLNESTNLSCSNCKRSLDRDNIKDNLLDKDDADKVLKLIMKLKELDPNLLKKAKEEAGLS